MDNLTEDMQTSDQIPPELQDIMDELEAIRLIKIIDIGKEVAKKRDEAVAFRKASGIETIWEEDEEYYQGVDDANRGTHPWTKSASTSGGITRERQKKSSRCSSFFNEIHPFVDNASARVGDILLPVGDWNFAVKATPVQDDAGDIPQETPVADVPEGTEQPLAQSGLLPAAANAPQPPNPEQPIGQAAPNQPDAATQAQTAAESTAEKAELKIRDYLVECSYHTEVRKVIEDSAKLGTGILKGPFPEKVISKKTTLKDGKHALEVVESIGPVSKCIDLWDFFPAPNCGEDIHKGSYTVERDRLSAKQLRDLKGTPGYLDDQIDKVIDEGPCKKNYSEGSRVSGSNTSEDDRFEVWYYYGLVDVSSLNSMQVKLTDSESDKKELPAIVTLVNETPIKAWINPLDSGEFPYDLMPWQRVAGSPWGIGVSRQGRTAQDMLNASARAMMDNGGLSARPMIILRKNAIVPADGVWELTSGKVWLATEQSDVRSVSDAFTAINIPMMQTELANLVQIAKTMMEDSTGITFLLQGQQGSAPDTVGGMELLHKNASTILRRIARVFDERITEPHIRRYYEYLLVYGPDDCKGDMKIEAIGSTSLVEREIQSMEAVQLLTMALNPAFGLDPKKAMTEVLKAKRMIPDKWQMDANTPAAAPAIIPAIEVAKINAAVREKELGANIEEKRWQVKLETTAQMHADNEKKDRDTEFNNSLANRGQVDAQVRMQQLQIQRELALLDYANKRNISLDEIKGQLAINAMRLKTQKELSGLDKQLDSEGITHPVTPQVAVAGTEEPGRAAPGEAFEG